MWHTVSMPKRLSKNSQPQDINQAAFQMVRRLTSTEPQEPSPKVTKSDISRVMAAMGRKGGKIGGKRRLDTMTAEQRHTVAQNAARSRWARQERPK